MQSLNIIDLFYLKKKQSEKTGSYRAVSIHDLIFNKNIVC